MKRVVSIFMSMIILIFLLSGCGKNSDNTEVYEKAAKEFLTFAYTYEGADKIVDENDFMSVYDKFMADIKKYEAKEGSLNDVIATRVALYPIRAGFNNKSKITVKNIDLKYYTKVSDTGAIVFDYTAIINSIPFKEGNVKEFKLTGQIQVVKVGKDYKILIFAPYDDEKWFNYVRGRGLN